LDNQRQQQISWNTKNANDQVKIQMEYLGDMLISLDSKLSGVSMEEFTKEQRAALEAQRKKVYAEYVQLGAGIGLKSFAEIED